MIQILLILSYLILIFNYIFMRIYREKLLQLHISLLASSPCKIISYLFIILFVYIHNKISKNKHYKRVIFSYIIIYLLFLLTFYFNLLPNLEFKQNNLFYLMLNKFSIILFYIFSEFLAVFISMIFFNICNNFIHKNHNTNFYKNLFIYSQIGLFLAASTLLYNPSISIWPLIISSLSLLIIFYIILFKNNFKLEKIISSEFNEFKTPHKKLFNKNLLIIPLMTICCGIIGGGLDQHAKFMLNSLHSNSMNYTRAFASLWILQSILSLSFGFIFKYLKISSFKITPLFLLINTFILFFLNYFFTLSITVYYLIFIVIGFKTLKYSLHSPTKENFINNSSFSNEILQYEGYFGKFGKNITAIIFSTLLFLNFSWKDIALYILPSVFSLSIFWTILSCII